MTRSLLFPRSLSAAQMFAREKRSLPNNAAAVTVTGGDADNGSDRHPGDDLQHAAGHLIEFNISQ